MQKRNAAPEVLEGAYRKHHEGVAFMAPYESLRLTGYDTPRTLTPALSRREREKSTTYQTKIDRHLASDVVFELFDDELLLDNNRLDEIAN